MPTQGSSFLDTLTGNCTICSSFKVLESDPIDTYREMFYHIFLWALFSSVFVHSLAASIAFCCLRRHKVGRWYALALALMGLVGPLTWGAISSAVIAWIYRNSSETMPSLYALVAGLSQTIVCVIVSFSRIYATL